MCAFYKYESIKAVVIIKLLTVLQETVNMKYLCALLFCVVILDLVNCHTQYFRYPSGVQVWVQKVKVIEVDEYGNEIPSLDDTDYENQPGIDVRLQTTVENDMPLNSAISGESCPVGSTRFNGICVSND